jgi:hypothetical protein
MEMPPTLCWNKSLTFQNWITFGQPLCAIPIKVDEELNIGSEKDGN